MCAILYGKHQYVQYFIVNMQYCTVVINKFNFSSQYNNNTFVFFVDTMKGMLILPLKTCYKFHECLLIVV